MKMKTYNIHLLLFLLVCSTPMSLSLGFSWPFSFSSSSHSRNSPPLDGIEMDAMHGSMAEFSMESIESNPRGLKMLENAQRRVQVLNSCWQDAYRNLFSSCSDILTDKEKQSRLGWHLSDCFQRDSGRPPFPKCDAKASMMKCLKNLNDAEQKIYLEFFLETNAICHQLQNAAFKHQMERLVNDLAKSARVAEDKLEKMEEKTEDLLHNSEKIHGSLTSIDLQTQQLAQASGDVKMKIDDVLSNSVVIVEQTKAITASQDALKEGQQEMKEKIQSGMAFLKESYESLGVGMEKLKEETVGIEREIKEVGESMSSKMQDLQSTADDIGNIAGQSLDKQKRLLDGQEIALEGLDHLRKFQSQALEESRDSLQQLAEFTQKQQEQLLKRQDQIRESHELLVQSSQSILAAQEEFKSRQANIFTALDKLFTLHNAILAESRFIRSFFFYASVIFVLYMLTSTKQTFGIRARLYLGLCLTFILELAIIRFKDDFDQQLWISSKVFLARSSFLALASIQILYSIFTFRDYEVLNHHMLQTLMQKINIMEQNTGKNYLSLSTESDITGYSWIEEELPEDVDAEEDPNFVLLEEVAENSITATSSRKYDLRPRNRPIRWH